MLLLQPFDLYLAAEHKGLQQPLIVLAEQLRDEMPGLRVRVHCSGLKNISSKARQTGAPWVVLVREENESLIANLWYNSEPTYDVQVNNLSGLLQQQQQA